MMMMMMMMMKRRRRRLKTYQTCRAGQDAVDGAEMTQAVHLICPVKKKKKNKKENEQHCPGRLEECVLHCYSN